MTSYHSRNSPGASCLRVVYKYSYLQAAYLFIIQQTQNADFATCITKLSPNVAFEIQQRQENSGFRLLISPPYKVTIGDYNSELLKYTDRLFTPLHFLFPFAFNTLETMTKVVSL